MSARSSAKRPYPYLPDPTEEDLANEAYYEAIDWASGDEPEKVKKLLLVALKLRPDFVAAQLSLSEVYDNLNDAAQSRAWTDNAYDTTLKLFPVWPDNFTWHIPKYRPYLFAICQKACQLHKDNKTEEAEKLYRLLLKFTPNDNQGVRYLLAGLYNDITPDDVDRMTEEGNDLQDWSVLENMLEEQNAKHHFWNEPAG